MSRIAEKKFTGWHMTAILTAFFGVVIAVNFTMARMAISSFGGTVVDNSYVASQNYNRWLEAADRQEQLGWTVKTALSANRFVNITVQKADAPLPGVTAVADALHPLGRAQDVALDFKTAANGQLVSTTALPAGRWNLRISVRQGPDVYKSVARF